MYERKASELQHPTSMIVYIGSFVRYIIMASDARTEWVPIALLEKPRVSDPMVSTVEQRSIKTSLGMILEKDFPSWKVKMLPVFE